MHKHLLLILTAAVAGLAIFASPTAAQQKTVKACEAEWRANKAANQAAGVTEKAYVEKCRAAGAAVTPSAPAATTAKPAAAPATAARPVKTVKACEDEWRANKAANQAAGVTQKSYVEKCRAGTTAAQPAPAPAAPAARTTTAPPPAADRPSSPTTASPSAAPAQPPARAPATAGQPAAANQYASEAQAKLRCPADTVVWVNLDSKIYHYSTNRNYGRTKSGTYMCEKDTVAAGMRAAKNEKRP